MTRSMLVVLGAAALLFVSWPSAQMAVPEIPYESAPNPFKMPASAW